ncbi:GMP synthase [Euzebya pacifica]|uniref:GMP synthase [glutamine-hydrolyzing] n=1 Tax=Euzebya pacifica TaxID=1608957 RepID=A0A346XTF1_9ACTN|nr:glutamine-hydrolyzing GMP synthase [Euzebya pacifica]AXV05498.1 GMP synthase [Euzebya pacifica]
MSTNAQQHDTVLVVDFGAQYAQVIARRVREAHVYSEIVGHDITAEEVAARKPKGLILSGGPKSVHVEGAPTIDPGILELGIPTLGICYGHQVIAQALGGTVARTDNPEFGRTDFRGDPSSTLLADQPEAQTVWMSHRDAVSEVPEGFTAIGTTTGGQVAAMEAPEKGIFSVQYHPEVSHTPHGQDVIKSFLHAAGAHPSWTAFNVIEESVEAIRAQVGDAEVLCGLSGGVDSAVAAALVHRAIGDKLTCVFVDHGLLRHGEAEQVQEAFGEHFDVNLVTVKAADQFLEHLAGVTEPEEKRKIIGREFIRVFEQAAREHAGDAKYLVQGTLYPDVIESGHGSASTIKSHHNVGGLPDDMEFDLVEPLRWLFKDEVRKVGEELGLPEEMVWRQPFPGPGLGVRIIGEVTGERLDLLRAADRIVLAELKRAGLEREIWQSFAVLPAIRSVGVQGDERTYGHPIIIRAVTSEDAMTADFARIPYDVLERIATRVINEVDGINRVAYDVTSKPPGTIEWE